MSRPRTILAAVALLSTFASCRQGSKQLDRRVSLRHEDKIPYGTKVAFDGLNSLFPNSTISYDDKPLSARALAEGKTACIIVAAQIDPSQPDINSILDFVGAGNHVFISARRFGDSLLHALGLKASYGYGFSLILDSLRLSILQPVTGDSLHFSYPGDSYEGWVTAYDPKYTSVLGRDRDGRPDFVRFTYKGGGSLCLQFAPLAFSNFFLLHKHNIGYYEAALSYLPESVQNVVWDGYFVHGRKGNRTPFRFILSNRSFAWAFLLLLLLFLIIYVFESKRRQRPVPIVQPLQNTSLEFVRTIGRLYFQRRDNLNLATKMVAHFQDLVRTRYNLAASALDEDLAERLAYRTGYRREDLSELIGYMRALPEKSQVPDQELLDFHRQLEAFYKIV